jgi:RNA polymerase sigma-70 factor (ECF subfamily)
LLEPAAADANDDERLLLEKALRELPPEQREVVYLKVYEGLTFHEIGQRCEISLNTAASRYRYAIEAMRRLLHVDET